MSDGEYKIYGLWGAEYGLSNHKFCESERVFRRQLLLWQDKQMTGNNNYLFDECNNFYTYPEEPVACDILDHLHKKADFQ